MPDPTPTRLHLSLPSTLASVDTIEQTMLAHARLAGFDDDTACGLALCAREAAINAILHGNRQDPDRPCLATFAVEPDALTLTVADQGTGFDPAGVPDPTADENLLRTSGRGVLIMNTYMDSVVFRPLHPGTEVTLTRRRA